MEIKAVLGFAIIIALLALGLAGMFLLGRPRKRKGWPTETGHGGDGGVYSEGGGDSGGHSGGHSDGGGHGGH